MHLQSCRRRRAAARVLRLDGIGPAPTARHGGPVEERSSPGAHYPFAAIYRLRRQNNERDCAFTHCGVEARIARLPLAALPAWRQTLRAQGCRLGPIAVTPVWRPRPPPDGVVLGRACPDPVAAADVPSRSGDLEGPATRDAAWEDGRVTRRRRVVIIALESDDPSRTA